MSHVSARTAGLRGWALLGAALALVALAPGLGALAGAAPAVGRPALVIAPPWTDAAAAVEAAGGRVIALRSGALATLAVFPDPGALARLAAEGAWARDGRILAAICGATP